MPMAPCGDGFLPVIAWSPAGPWVKIAPGACYLRCVHVQFCDMVKASDILAELDCVIIETRKAFSCEGCADKMKFLEDAEQVLSGFREHVRSDAFRREVERCRRKGEIPVNKTASRKVALAEHFDVVDRLLEYVSNYKSRQDRIVSALSEVRSALSAGHVSLAQDIMSALLDSDLKQSKERVYNQIAAMRIAVCALRAHGDEATIAKIEMLTSEPGGSTVAA